MASLYYWGPKIVGRPFPTGLGMLAGLTLVGGVMLAAIPDAISGFLDQPDLWLPRPNTMASKF